MKTYYAIIYRPGPAWVEGQSVYEQRLLEHGQFMQRLLEEGRLVLAGPFTDDAGGMLVAKLGSMDEARELVDCDPGVRNGVFRAEVHPWHIAFEA